MKYPDDFINQVIHGDCLEVLKQFPDNCIDAIITDPPYALGFMGKEWDTFDKRQFGRKGLEGKNDLKVKKNFEILPRYKNWDGYYEFSFNWAKEVFRVLKPGGYLLAFGGTRTYHRMTCGIEDAGFEIRDCIMWIYGSGFPKSLNIAKSIDRLIKEGTASLNSVGDNTSGALGYHKLNFEQGYRPKDYTNVERREYEITEDIAKKWEGWGTALKPAYEPIVVARKPLSERNVALNVLKWGTGGINIDACRVGTDIIPAQKRGKAVNTNFMSGGFTPEHQGRFPANVILGCTCDKVIEWESEVKDDTRKGGIWKTGGKETPMKTYKGGQIIHTNPECPCYMLDKQSGINASRFFYCAKASKKERNMGLEGYILKSDTPEEIKKEIEKYLTSV
jgi:site-specific DNA-methyltransferase (adenine-specific)